MKLHLGCGVDKKDGYVNCDCSSMVNPDIVMDIEDKLPFDDNSVDEILMNHILEHINNFIQLMHEIHRVSKPGCKIIIRTPFYSAWGQFNDPTHVRFFTPYTFDYFKHGLYSHEVGCDTDMFNVNKVVINFGVGPSSKFNFLINPIVNLSHKIYCRFFAWIFPCSEIYYELEVIKVRNLNQKRKEVKNER